MTSDLANPDECRACGRPLLESAAVMLHASLLSGSDCSAWQGPPAALLECACTHVSKRVTADYGVAISNLYSSYAPHAQAHGREQQIWSARHRSSESRSEVIVRFLDEHDLLDSATRVLDYGCGNAPFLNALSQISPRKRWLVGADIGTHLKEQVLSIRGVSEFINLEDEDPRGPFDLIVLSHVLEHVARPAETLASLAASLEGSGILVVQIPNFHQNPFDLAIADHLSHFTEASLSSVVAQAGLEVALQPVQLVEREVTLVVRPRTSNDGARMRSTIADPPASSALDDGITFLHRWSSLITEARDESETSAIYIFGSSIGASVTKGICDDVGVEVQGFLDQDAERVGNSFHGLEILPPTSEVVGGQLILVPLLGNAQQRVTHALSHAGAIIATPTWPFAR